MLGIVKDYQWYLLYIGLMLLSLVVMAAIRSAA